MTYRYLASIVCVRVFVSVSKINSDICSIMFYYYVFVILSCFSN